MTHETGLDHPYRVPLAADFHLGAVAGGVYTLALVLIGLLVENLVFGSIERLTVKRWGVQR